MIVLRLFTGRRFLLTLSAIGLLALVATIARFSAKPELGAVFAVRAAVQNATPVDISAYSLTAGHLVRGCFTSEFDPIAEQALRRTPIISAALIQDWRSVDGYIRNAAGVETADALGLTPLMIAAKFGQVEVMDSLLRGLADPLATDLNGRTALYYAVAARHAEAASTLLARTPLDRLSESESRDLLEAAFVTRDWRIVEPVILRFPPLNAWSAPATALLTDAIGAGDEAHVRALMSHHRPQPLLPGTSMPLLAHAVIADDTPLLRILMRSGADPNTTLPAPTDKRTLARIGSNYIRGYVEADSGITVLMLAAGLGKPGIVQALLAAGANRNLMTAHYKMLALYFAARSPSYRCTQILLGSGLPPDQLRIEITLARQSLEVVKNGVPILKTTCSTGRDGYSTQPGHYVITDKDRDHRSTIYKVAMPYFMRLNCRDFGMHEGNVASPHASHGCIRLPGDIAQRLFSELPTGTVVNVN